MAMIAEVEDQIAAHDREANQAEVGLAHGLLLLFQLAGLLKESLEQQSKPGCKGLGASPQALTHSW